MMYDIIYCINNCKGLEMKNNIEMIYEDDNMNCSIVRRKDNNKVFKLCYDEGDSLCEVYKLENSNDGRGDIIYIDSDESEVY